MKSFLIAGTSQDLFPPRMSARVAALRRRRRRQRLRSWTTPLAVFTVGASVALVVAAGVGH
jgi:negative regulator of sigma E activity